MPSLVYNKRTLPLRGEVTSLPAAFKLVFGAPAMNFHVLSKVRLLGETFAAFCTSREK